MNQDKKKVKGEIQKINELIKIIPTDNITEINELIYVRVKKP